MIEEEREFSCAVGHGKEGRKEGRMTRQRISPYHGIVASCLHEVGFFVFLKPLSRSWAQTYFKTASTSQDNTTAYALLNSILLICPSFSMCVFLSCPNSAHVARVLRSFNRRCIKSSDSVIYLDNQLWYLHLMAMHAVQSMLPSLC